MNLAELMTAARRKRLQEKYGLDKMTAAQVAKTASVLLESLPADRLKGHADELLKTGRVIDRVLARQIGILLFAQQEMTSCMKEVPPNEALQACKELIEQHGPDFMKGEG